MKKSVIIILLLAMILSVSLSGCCILTQNPTYTASGTMYVHCTPTQSDSSVCIAYPDLSMPKYLSQTCINMGRSSQFRSIIEEQFPDEEYTYTFESTENTEVIKVSVTSENPETSAKICNEILTVFPSFISVLFEGTTCKIVDFASAPSKPDKISYFP